MVAVKVAVFKHMKSCCPDVIDPNALADDPVEAAAKTLAVQARTHRPPPTQGWPPKMTPLLLLFLLFLSIYYFAVGACRAADPPHPQFFAADAPSTLLTSSAPPSANTCRHPHHTLTLFPPQHAHKLFLSFQSDAGLGGVDLDAAKWPHGEPGWVCYLCAQRTMTLPSFRFHLRACARAWDNYELTKHPSRWKAPPRPPCSDAAIPLRYGPELAAYNARALEVKKMAWGQLGAGEQEGGVVAGKKEGWGRGT